MDLEPKIEPGSPSTNHVNLDRLDDGADMMETLDLEGMTIPSLVHVLLGACRTETFDRVGGVLVSRDLGLKQEIQLLQEKLEMERLSRLQLENDFKKREEIVEKWKKLQESHEALLKEVKIGDLQNNKETVRVLRKTNIEMKQNYEAKLKEDKVTIEDIRKKNIELESEVNKLKEKRVEDGNGLDILRKKNAELALELKEKRVEEANVVVVLRKENARLEHELFELNKDRNELEVLRKKNGELDNEVMKLKVRRVEDGNAFDVIKRKNCELEAKVLELEKLNEKWLNDSNALDELRGKVEVLEDENNALVGIEIKNSELKEKVKKNLATICELKCKNRKLEDEKRKVEILLKSLNTEFRGLDDRNASLEGVNELRNDIVDEAGPLEVKGASSVVHVEAPARVAVPSASQVNPVANAPVAIPSVKKRKSKPLHVKNVKKVRFSKRLKTLKVKMIDGPGKDASNPLVIGDGDEDNGTDDGDGIDEELERDPDWYPDWY